MKTKGKSYLILGAGQQGVAAAYDAALLGQAAKVTLADISPILANQAVKRLYKLLKIAGSKGVSITGNTLNCKNKEALKKMMKGHDAVLSALPYYLNPAIARAAIASKVHYCDLGGYFGTTKEIIKLSAMAKKAGVSLITDCGVAPGLCNSLAACGISRLEKATDVHMYCGGLPMVPKPPLGYKIVFNLEGVLGNYFGEAYVLKNGKICLEPCFSGREVLDMGMPLGKLEAVMTGGATSTCPWTYRGKLLNYDYKTLRYPGHYEKIETLKLLGLLDTEAVEFEGHKIIPRKFFVKLAGPHLKMTGDRDLLVMRVIVLGSKDGWPTRIVYDLLEYEDPETGFTAMQRTTGFSAAIILEMLGEGQITERGFVPVEKAVDGAVFLEEIRKRGILVSETITAEKLAA